MTVVSMDVSGAPVEGFLAVPDGGRGPGVLVVQEWWGLVPHIRSVVERLAEAGFVAMAVEPFAARKALLIPEGRVPCCFSPLGRVQPTPVPELLSNGCKEIEKESWDSGGVKHPELPTLHNRRTLDYPAAKRCCEQA